MSAICAALPTAWQRSKNKITRLRLTIAGLLPSSSIIANIGSTDATRAITRPDLLQKRTMLHPQEAPRSADHATTSATTIAKDRSSFEEIGQKLAKFELSNRTHVNTLSAMVTSQGPQKTSHVETYVGPQYKIRTIAKNLRKMGSRLPCGPPSGPPLPSSYLPPLDPYHVPNIYLANKVWARQRWEANNKNEVWARHRR
jgi:hypothetical protein